MVNLPDQFWNTLWLDLIRMDEELANLNVNPEDIEQGVREPYEPQF